MSVLALLEFHVQKERLSNRRRVRLGCCGKGTCCTGFAGPYIFLLLGGSPELHMW